MPNSTQRTRLCTSIAIVIFCTLSLALSGCGGDSKKAGGDKAASDKVLKIAVIPKGTSHEFWKSVHFGAEKAAKELGNVEIIWRGPVLESDTGSQIEVVKSMVTMGVDGIVLAPNQKGGLVDSVEEAIDEGIPVVIFDSGLAAGPKIVSYIATDNFKGGQIAGDEMAKAIGGKGNVILLRYLAGSESTEQRELGFLDAIGKHPEIKVVSSDQFGGDNATSAKEKVDQLLQIHQKDLAGIFAVCEPNANGTLESLKNAGIEKQVKFIAFDPSKSLIDAMKSGSCAGIVLQDPVKMGYASVKTLVGAIKGEKAESFISTGEYFASPANMDQPEMAQLLKPPLAD